MDTEPENRNRVKQNCQQHALPKEICIPEHFKGVLQINLQQQRETETETVTQTQTQATAVAVTQMQAQLQAVNAQLAALQSQLQLLFLAVLGSPAGGDASERMQALRDLVATLRANPQ